MSVLPSSFSQPAGVRHTPPAVNMTEYDREPSGMVRLIGRIKYVAHHHHSLGIVTDDILSFSLWVLLRWQEPS